MAENPLSRPIQFCAGIVLVIAVLSSVAIALDRGQLPARISERVIPAAMILAGGTALCGILLGLTALLEKDKTDPVSKRLLTEIRDKLAASSIPVATVVAPGSEHSSRAGDETAARIVLLLEEIRDISLLDPPQRRERLERLLASRRQAALATIDALVQEARWTEASATLEQATATLGDSPAFAEARQRLASATQAAETTDLQQLQRDVLELQSAEQWDDAIAACELFLHRFPQSAAGRTFHAQAAQTRDANIDSIANKLYEEIRVDIEQRSWRRALGASQRLLAKCPHHPRAQKIKAQMDLIRDNADTEQRNATEAHIHELVKSGRLKEAIELGEELVASYPLSPQAQVISRLVERLREKLEQQRVPSA